MAIDRNGGFIARNALIRQLAMPVGVCDNMIQVCIDQCGDVQKVEKSGKIVRDNDSRDVFFYLNSFVRVTTKVIPA